MKRLLALSCVLSACVVIEQPSLEPCDTASPCAGSEQCLDGFCRPPSCQNGRVDGLETDLDCGGAHCAPCGGERLCLVAGDCDSRECVNHQCVAPTCSDAVANGDESDVDCGGSTCPKCPLGGACEIASDCLMGACVDGHCSTTPTGGCSGLVCGGACIDQRVDPLHCGRCGNVCPAPQACVAGQCASVCLGGSRSCGGACVDIASNPQHCGGCNQPCAPGAVCAASTCQPLCEPLQTRCGMACVSLDRDPLNCGLCGRVCPSGTACVANRCEPLCNAPSLVCGSACVDPRSDPMNCGGCNSPCMTSGNAGKVCVGGTCRITFCAPGFDDCNNQAADGCEVDLNLSPTDCGQCGRVCSGTDTCVGGACCASTLPSGSYLSSCRACELCNGILSCQCRDASSVWQNTSLPLGPQPCTITNCNGALQCTAC